LLPPPGLTSQPTANIIPRPSLSLDLPRKKEEEMKDEENRESHGSKKEREKVKSKWPNHTVKAKGADQGSF
jgi:hypothetical protein